MQIFQRLKASLRLREAVRKADEAHQETGERYYVMPASADGKLIIMDRLNFRRLKHKGYITNRAYVRDLEVECFYFTPYRDGSCALTPEVETVKRKQYFGWYADCIRKSKNKKRNGIHGKVQTGH